MDSHDLPPRRLIAGAGGPERLPYRRDPDEPRWFEPHHVRSAAASRDRMAGFVAAGADVLVAPTWLTHRRALLAVGETRRAQAWTAAAIRVAREAVDVGLEQRDRAEDPAGPDAAPTPPRVTRHPILVAGVLPQLDTAPEPGVGRLLPRDVASERDHRAQAGVLAEAGPDLVLVDGPPSIAQARVAVEAAVETGLPVWVSVPVVPGRQPQLASGESVEAWAEAMVHAGADVLLLDPSPGADVAAGHVALTTAGVAPERTGVLPAIDPAAADSAVEEAARRWLDAGAWHLGIAVGATAARLGRLRAALDTVAAEAGASRDADRERWMAILQDAARRAPGGRAAWIGPRPADDPPLPAGFAWTVVAGAGGAAGLPAGELRLVVCVDTRIEPRAVAALPEPGGILLAVGRDPAAVAGTGLRVLAVDAIGDRTTILARRDP